MSLGVKFATHQLPATFYSAFVVYRRKSNDAHLSTGVNHAVISGDHPITKDEYIARVRSEVERDWDTALHGERSLYEFSFGGCVTSLLTPA